MKNMNEKDLGVAALTSMNGKPMAQEDELRDNISVKSKSKSASALANSASDTPTEDVSEPKAKRGRRKTQQHQFPVEPRTIQVVTKPRTYINHSYRDFSKVPAELNEEVPEKIEDMTFPQKIHHMLSQDEYKGKIGWMPHGRAFGILVPKKLEEGKLKVLNKYFGHSRYSSFLRQLSNHGFKHLSEGTDRNCYYHEVCKLQRDRTITARVGTVSCLQMTVQSGTNKDVCL
jgi:hypothetical protein